ncbi:MAG: zinc-binding dehydrogenase [Pseudomonadota bacterium]
MTPGTRLLVHAAAGGVGSIVVQLAKALGAEVTALTSPATMDFVRGLGADHVIDRTTAYEQAIGDFDIVLDAFGPPAQARSWGLLKPGGILISLVAPPDQDEAARHGVRATMTFGAPDAAALEKAAALADAGRLKPVIQRTYPVEEAVAAMAEVESGTVRGKIVLTY